MKDKRTHLLTTGEVVEILGNSSFRVRCENGAIVIAHISAEFRSKRQRGVSSRINLGSKVKLKLALDDLSRGNVVGFA